MADLALSFCIHPIILSSQDPGGISKSLQNPISQSLPAEETEEKATMINCICGQAS